MNFSFYSEAENEFLESIDFYEQRQKGLGLEFSREVFATIQRIIENSESWPRYSMRTRRCLTNRFPFAIVYRVNDGQIFIWAVAHHSRKPGYWLDRLN